MKARLDGIDLARFLALAGMMLVHLGPPQANSFALPSWGEIVTGGRAATLFAVLAGVSLSLVHRHAPRGSGSAQSIAIRAVLLFALGISLGSLEDISIYIILAYYAVLFVIAIPFRDLSARTLLAIAAGWALAGPVFAMALRRILGPGDASQVEVADLADPIALLAEITVVGIYPMLVWTAYVVLGLGIGKLDLAARQTAWTLTVVGLGLVAITVSLARVLVSWGVPGDAVQGREGWAALFFTPLNGADADSWQGLAVLGIHSSTPLNVVSASGSALAVIGICLLIMGMGSPLVARATAPLRAAGMMTLTLYTAHALLKWAGAAYGLTLTGGYYAEWIAQLIFLTIAATLWLQMYRRGPLEALIHRVAVAPRREDARTGNEKGTP